MLDPVEERQIGRVAVVTNQGRPQIFPVNYRVHDRTVVFVTGSTVLQAWAPLGHLAFKVDLIDPWSHEGWDVVVSGEGVEVTGAVDNASLLARFQRVDQWPLASRTIG